MSSTDTFDRIIQKHEPGSRLLRRWTLLGGVSAQVTALEVERPDGQTAKLIVRQHGPVDLRHNPQIAADEYKLLQIARSAGLAAPEPYYVDQSGEILPTPYIVIAYVEGSTDVAPANLDDAIRQLAVHLARIHAVDADRYDLAFLPDQHEISARTIGERPALLDESIGEARIRDALEATWPRPGHNPNVLLHGDYWPGNILWHDNQLVAVIDWEDARRGDPLSDLASSRLEILWAFGSDAMQDFTRHYLAMTTLDTTNLPYWELLAALRPAFKLGDWAADPVAEQRMRDRHDIFVAQAFRNIADSEK